MHARHRQWGNRYKHVIARTSYSRLQRDNDYKNVIASHFGTDSGYSTLPICGLNLQRIKQQKM